MLIKTQPDVYEKLRHLAGMATDDVLDESPGSRVGNGGSNPLASPFEGGGGIGPYRGGATPYAGIYRAAMPNGKKISLFRVMLTDHCEYDCHYCPNSYWVPRERFGFKVDELASLFAEAHRRHMVDGLFLSSGVFNNADTTMDRLVQVVEAIRTRHGFKGYVHLKVMPGTSAQYLEAAQRLGTRLSVNIEAPSALHLGRVSGMKRFDEDILRPMASVHRLMSQRYGTAVGQATQLVVGAADETDRDVYQLQQQLYGQWNFKRIYYAPFHPVQFTPLEEHVPTPMVRAHRLNQLDWLLRVYRLSTQEMDLAFGEGGQLDPHLDPKLAIAGKQWERFPVDINVASREELVRVPGIGPIAAERIMNQRRQHSVTRWQELRAMGVVVKRALPFIRFPGHRPERAVQGQLPLLQGLSVDPPVAEPAKSSSSRQVVARLHQAFASSGCAGCPLNPGTCGQLPVSSSADRIKEAALA